MVKRPKDFLTSQIRSAYFLPISMNINRILDIKYPPPQRSTNLFNSSNKLEFKYTYDARRIWDHRHPNPFFGKLLTFMICDNFKNDLGAPRTFWSKRLKKNKGGKNNV